MLTVNSGKNVRKRGKGMSKILLVNPPKFDGKGVMREEGICGVSGYIVTPVQMLFCHKLLSDEGHIVDLIDMQVQGNKVTYENYDAVVVWCSIYGSLYHDIEELRKAKQAGCQTIAIVNRPIIEKEIMERFPFIDYFVRYHERERTLVELFKGNLDKGLIYRKNGKLVVTEQWPYQNMKHLNFQLPWNLLSMEKYDRFLMIITKGCGYSCNFCEFRGWPFIHRNVDVLLDELEHLSTYDKFIKIETNDMFLNKTFARDFLGGIIKRGIDVEFQACVRANHVTDEMLSLASKAGMESNIQLGVESACEELRNKINKRLPDEVLWKAINAIKKHKMKLELLLMWGFPWDSHDTANDMINFIDKVSPDKIAVSSVRPIIGTPLYNDFRESGLLQRDLVLDDYVSVYGYYWFCGTQHLTREQVKQEHQRILTEFQKKHGGLFNTLWRELRSIRWI